MLCDVLVNGFRMKEIPQNKDAEINFWTNRFAGRLGCWAVGLLGCWDVALLFCLAVGPQGRRAVILLGCGAVGLLVG